MHSILHTIIQRRRSVKQAGISVQYQRNTGITHWLVPPSKESKPQDIATSYNNYKHTNVSFASFTDLSANFIQKHYYMLADTDTLTGIFSRKSVEKSVCEQQVANIASSACSLTQNYTTYYSHTNNTQLSTNFSGPYFSLFLLLPLLWTD